MPNIGELFDPGGQTFQFIDDPCDIGNLNEGTEFRAANQEFDLARCWTRRTTPIRIRRASPAA